MKRLGILALVLALIFSFGACGKPAEKPAEKTDQYEIAMITDIGTIDDKSFNQGTWEGIAAYATEKGKTHKYYKPSEKTDDAYLSAIDLAVKGGAKVVVTPGWMFGRTIFIAQDQYPDVHFIVLDTFPNDNGNPPTFKTNENAVGIVYADEQSGYLAGYAAVKEGFTKLGFMGGIPVPAVVKYGYGFAQGAEAAAKEMGIASVDLKYHYTMNFDATPENQALAASWYAGGTEVIFACGGAVGNSVMAAAEAANKAVIGVDVDQSAESTSVITSAMKNLGGSVAQILADYYADKFPGGEGLTFDASKDGVKLPMDTSRFKTFTQADYDKVFKELADGKVTIKKDTDAKEATGLGLTIVKVTLV